MTSDLEHAVRNAIYLLETGRNELALNALRAALTTPPAAPAPTGKPLTAAQRKALEYAARRDQLGIWSRLDAHLNTLRRLETLGLLEAVDSNGAGRSDNNVDVCFVITDAGKRALEGR